MASATRAQLLGSAQQQKQCNGRIIHAKWRQFDLQGTEVKESLNGIEYTTRSVLVALIPYPVILRVGGESTHAAEIETICNSLLTSVVGQTNWVGPSQPEKSSIRSSRSSPSRFPSFWLDS
jgi:hypothetical protein